jgi:transcriptional regulator with XRE-family HTH domain
VPGCADGAITARLSQLALAALTGTTARHVSFLETGRSRPNRHMVLRLAEALEVNPRATNELLHSAGLPAAYPHAELTSSDLAPYRAAITRLLTAHEPYPALVLDRRYNVLLANEACAALFGPGVTGSNFVTDALANPATAQTILNWPEVAWAGLDRLRENANRTPFDAGLQTLIGRAETALAGVPRPHSAEAGLIVCPWFRIGGSIVRTIALTARFDHAADVTLDELRAELIYPLDEGADRFFRGNDGGGTRG